MRSNVTRPGYSGLTAGQGSPPTSITKLVTPTPAVWTLSAGSAKIRLSGLPGRYSAARDGCGDRGCARHSRHALGSAVPVSALQRHRDGRARAECRSRRLSGRVGCHGVARPGRRGADTIRRPSIGERSLPSDGRVQLGQAGRGLQGQVLGLDAPGILIAASHLGAGRQWSVRQLPNCPSDRRQLPVHTDLPYAVASSGAGPEIVLARRVQPSQDPLLQVHTPRA